MIHPPKEDNSISKSLSNLLSFFTESGSKTNSNSNLTLSPSNVESSSPPPFTVQQSSENQQNSLSKSFSSLVSGVTPSRSQKHATRKSSSLNLQSSESQKNSLERIFQSNSTSYVDRAGSILCTLLKVAAVILGALIFILAAVEFHGKISYGNIKATTSDVSEPTAIKKKTTEHIDIKATHKIIINDDEEYQLHLEIGESTTVKLPDGMLDIFLTKDGKIGLICYEKDLPKRSFFDKSVESNQLDQVQEVYKHGKCGIIGIKNFKISQV